VTTDKLPLGRATPNPDKYDPGALFAISRAESRGAFSSGSMPFRGVDIWNAWDLSWLGHGCLPVVATAEIRIPADTPNLVESKSLKLYLGSYAMSTFESPAVVADTIRRDLGAVTGGPVDVRVTPVADTEADSICRMPGFCLDALSISCDTFEVNAELLRSDPAIVVNEDLYTDLMRSLCPVTAQPDIGSLAVHYHGPKIDPASLLRYVVSFRQHNDFHEACVERMFVDLLERCKPEKLSVMARFQRRGGIDINPFRSNFEDRPPNLRLWRQ
jgi:7-cyano-7-deazaguanine reductase